MSETKGPFDEAVDAIRGWQRVLEPYSEMHIDEIADLEEAIHVLLDWARWKPLIEAAGKMDKNRIIEHWKQTTICPCPKFPKMDCSREVEGLCADSEYQLRALLEALPEKGEK